MSPHRLRALVLFVVVFSLKFVVVVAAAAAVVVL